MRWARTLLKSAATLPYRGRGRLDRIDVEEFAYRSKRSLEALCRVRAQPVHLGGDEGLCRILGRYKLFVDTRDQGLGAHLLLDGYWERGLTIHLAREVRPGMVAVDVGANFGYYTILLAALVGETGRVLAIEPAPETAAMLRRSLALNGFQEMTTVVEAAAGERDGEHRLFYVPQREPKNAQLVASAGGHDPAGSLYEVTERRLDALLAEERRVDVVKIDAEGAEEAIVAGMSETLRRDRPRLVLEFNAARARDPEALLATLWGIYGEARWLDLSGRTHVASRTQLVRERVGRDWLLVFAC